MRRSANSVSPPNAGTVTAESMEYLARGCWKELSLCQSWLATLPTILACSRPATSPSTLTLEMSASSAYLKRCGPPLSLRRPRSSGPRDLAKAICWSWLRGWSRHTSTACVSIACSTSFTCPGVSGWRRSMPLACAAKGCRDFSCRAILSLPSLDLDVRGLHDTRPLVDLLADLLVVLLGAGPHGLQAQLRHARAHLGAAHRLRDVGADLLQQRRRQARRGDHADGTHRAESGHGVGDQRNLRIGNSMPWAGQRDHLQALVLHEGHRGIEDVEQQRHAAADHVLLRRCAALVGHMDHADARHVREHLAGQVRAGARPGRGEAQG